MTAMRRREGPRAPLFYAAPLLWFGALASAQSVDLSRLEACNALPNDEARLACFEAIVNPAEGAPEPIPEVATAPAEAPPTAAEAENVIDPAAEPAAPPPVAADSPPEAAGATATAAGAAMVARDPEPDPVVEPAPEPVVEPEPEPAEPVRAEAGSSDFGREHIEQAEPEAPEELRAVVTEAVRKRNRGVTFTLDNGQVWQQVDDRYFPYPKDEDFEIVISQGMMGDYRLRVGGDGRMIRVRRTK